jgi:sortase A
VAARTLRVAAAALAAVAAWQIGDAAWIHGKAVLGQYLLRRAWARTPADGSPVKPWPWADTWPVARLRVPAHGIDLVVLDGVGGGTLAWAPGHAGGSARPGDPGTAIVSGHRDTHFRFLQRLRPGDEVIVETPGRAPARFRVREAAVVDSRTAVIRTAGDGEATLVLLTCYPFDALTPGGPLRYAVAAEAVSAGRAHPRRRGRRRTAGQRGRRAV